MTVFKATIHDGKLQFDQPLNLPEGAQVEVVVRVVPRSITPLELTDDDIDGDSPEAIARWISYYESLTPPVMSDEEWEAWQQRRREDREWEFAHAAEREAKIQRIFE